MTQLIRQVACQMLCCREIDETALFQEVNGDEVLTDVELFSDSFDTSGAQERAPDQAASTK